jgi:ribosomal protein S18 acetylase RimI-like enzyme
MPSPIEVVPRADADVPQLFALAQSVFADMPGWSDRRVLEVLGSDVVFVAHEDARPAGFVALRRELDEEIVIEQLFVAPGHEGHGVGHRLLAHAEGYAIAERARALRIAVEAGNWRARSFYRRCGFAAVEPELLELILPRSPDDPAEQAPRLE